MNPFRRAMFLLTLSAPMIWMLTEHGARHRSTAQYGFPQRLQAGLLMPMGTGFGSVPGDGLGSMTLLGAMLLSTTADGSALVRIGDGPPDLTTVAGLADGMRLLSSAGMAARAGVSGLVSVELASDTAAASDGARSDSVSLSSPGTPPDGAISAM